MSNRLLKREKEDKILSLECIKCYEDFYHQRMNAISLNFKECWVFIKVLFLLQEPISVSTNVDVLQS